MNNFGQAVWVETLKARRSRVPLFTALGFLLIPFVGGLFMVILKDPDLARRMGLISAKAQMFAGVADWPAYFELLAQAIAVGGILLFSIVAAWVFGREYADRTLKDLLALPTSRAAIVAAKFVIVALWCAGLAVAVYAIALLVGQAVALPPAAAEVYWRGSLTLLVTAVLTIALVSPIAFVASAGRGYLPPLGAAILFLVLAQIVAVLGWGEYFPWSKPALYAQAGEAGVATLDAVSFAIVLLTGLAGLAATLLWWQWADHAGP